MKKVRCSKLDIAMACASSLAETDAPYTPQSDAAEEGTVNHIALSFIPLGEDPPIEEIAEKYGMDASDLERMVRYGRQAWKEIESQFPNAKTEHRLDSDICGGTSDVFSLSLDGGSVSAIAINDWKSGWGQAEHPWQLTGYAYCARETHGMPSSGHVLGAETWLRHRQMRIHKFVDSALDNFRDRLKKQFDLIGKQYGPGGHCVFCPHANSCDARADYIRGTCQALAPIGETGLTREKIGELYDKSKSLKSALAQFDKLVDAELDQGPITLADGRRLTRVEYEQDEIDPLKAWPVIFEGPHPLTPDEAAEVIRIGKTALLSAIKSKAPKMKGAAFEREIMKALLDAGAIKKISRTKKTIIAA